MGCVGEVNAMAIPMLTSILGLLLLLGGCAIPPLPGTAGEISGPLRGIDLYATRRDPNKPGARYRTAGRDRFFASDRQVWVYVHWGLPGPGKYQTMVALRTPTGNVREERHFDFEAKGSLWSVGLGFALPQGEDAQQLAGTWRAEATLGGTVVGHRIFTFDPTSIRLRTEARVLIIQGTDDPQVATGDWGWRDPFAALQNVKAAHTILGGVLRDELARRFSHVDGPQQQPPAATSDATVLLRTKLGASPNPSAASELVLDVVHVPTRTTRTFRFRSSAGKEQGGISSSNYLQVGAADLAFQATASPEVLEALITATNAVPE
jgi:hypothetical protein